MKTVRNYFLAIGAIISMLLTFMVFFAAKDNQFVALDDFAYIVSNSNIKTFGWDTIVWSFTSFHEGNWHPLTMISLALDRYIWGVKPFGFHLTNILIHSCSVFCSCFLFSHLLRAAGSYQAVSDVDTVSEHAMPASLGLTGLSDLALAIGSIAAALFFGLHPLRVESVVWASERKDVLCIFFMITSLWTYLLYTEKKKSCSGVPFWRYRMFRFSLVLAALALMSKPTAVSLPLILCIVDWYPLKRISNSKNLFSSFSEKIPYFVLSVAGAILTLFAQQIAMKYAPVVGITSRLLVACKALLFYIAVTIWPFGLTAFYMHPGEIALSSLAEYLLYIVIVLSICIAVIWTGKRRPVWAAIWLFYVVTLLPMLGLIQVGGQWVADRYSYLPSLGIALLWGGGVALLSDRMLRDKRTPGALVCMIIAVSQLLFYTFQTERQISVWRNTETLATRIIDNTPHLSGAPYLARAIYRKDAGRYQQALEDVGEAMNIALRRGLTRTYPETAFEQAVILKQLGRFAEALAIIEWGIGVCVDPPPPDAVELRNELVRLAASKKGS